MKFKEYYKILEENPDTLDLDLNGMRVYLRWNTDTAKPFGFINWDVTFKSKGLNIPFFKNVYNSNELIFGNFKQTHNQLLRELISNLNGGIIYVEKISINKILEIDLSNSKLKDEIIKNVYEYSFPIYTRKVFNPSGRIWLYPKINKQKYIFISFWENTIQITKDHIEKILEFNNIPKNDYNRVYIEYPFSNDKKLLTFNHFDNIIFKGNEEEIHKIQNSQLSHLAAGFGGTFKNKEGFGTDAEAKKAKRAGYNSIAKYKNDRFPYRESYNIF